MRLEILISALKADSDKLIKTMNISSDAVLVNQCDKEGYEEIKLETGLVKVISSLERGVGNSRNLALNNSSDEIILFGDDDIVYVDSYCDLIVKEFEKHPEADGIFFNMDVDESRRTYHTEEFGPVTLRASGRYPTYALAIKRDVAMAKKLSFSPLFGGGAKYSCGEDSLFIMDALKAGVKLYKSPICIGREVVRPSTWFEGYTEKYFFDKGVLYHFLYKGLAHAVGARFILKHKGFMCKDVPPFKAYKLLCRGIKEGRSIKQE